MLKRIPTVSARNDKALQALMTFNCVHVTSEKARRKLITDAKEHGIAVDFYTAKKRGGYVIFRR